MVITWPRGQASSYTISSPGSLPSAWFTSAQAIHRQPHDAMQPDLRGRSP